MTAQTTNDILDETLDDLADLPQSKPYVAGAHACKMFITRPDPKKQSSYLVKFKHVDTLELANPGDEAPKPGDEAVMFIHTVKKDGQKNEFGQGQLKMILGPLSDAIGSRSISDCLGATKNGIDVVIVSGVKTQKDYPDQMTLAKIEMA